jgi:putative transposase
VLLRLSYLAVSSVFTVMGLLPLSGTAKDIEILAMRHQLAILQRQDDTPRLTSTDRACLAWPRSCTGFHGSGYGSCS